MKIAFVTKNVFSGLETLKGLAEKRGHTLDYITFDEVEITSFIKELEKRDIASYDVVHYQAGLKPDGGYALGKYLSDKKTVFINAGNKTLKKISKPTTLLARKEGLEAHALSVEIRKIKT